MFTDRPTLAQVLTDAGHPESSDLHALIIDIAGACRDIARHVAVAPLTGVLGGAGAVNVQGEQQQRLDVVANEIFLRANEAGGRLAGMVSEELDELFPIPRGVLRGRYLLAFDPLDGSSNIAVNVGVGSIFSILPAPGVGAAATTADFLRPGLDQVAAGYALYGPSTQLVLTVGSGVHAFTLDPETVEFRLTARDLRVPATTAEYAINASNHRFWEPPVRRYIDDCVAGASGPRGKDFNTRWVASLVVEAHRILTRGGVFLYPRDTKDPAKPGRLRLLYEAAPIALLIERAGGLASTGHERVLEITPTALHQRVPLVFGAREEVERVERSHAEETRADATSGTPRRAPVGG
ncbi:class 1 fructose-bisphosphatase [Nocardia sp. AG03]|uniref:class 1 fructose-bisphosphatase n=1 Tax=Nocardia sp. AG03 TaxID=3025312 RepID=UPI0024186770|nr:class 1 fructose-bisphosphatase [Nocardia sp. AG03]